MHQNLEVDFFMILAVNSGVTMFFRQHGLLAA